MERRKRRQQLLYSVFSRSESVHKTLVCLLACPPCSPPSLELPHRKQASHTSQPAMESEVAVVEQAEEAVLMQQVLSHQPSGISRRGLDTHSTAPRFHHMASSPAHEANPMLRQNLTKEGVSITPLELFNAPGALAANSSSLQSKLTAFTFRKSSGGLGLGARTCNCACNWFSRELGSCGALGLQLHFFLSVDNR